MQQQIARKRRQDALEYCRSMLGQLRDILEAERQQMSTFLVEMAYIELSDTLRAQREAEKAAVDKAA